MLEYIHNLSLTAEVEWFQEASHLFFNYQEEFHKIEERMWEAGQLKDASTRRLEGTNALNRIKAALQELDHRMTLWQGHVHTERGGST